MALRFLGENNVHFYQEDLPMVIRSIIFKDINKKLRPIINHIATEFLRHLLLGQVGTIWVREAAELSVIFGRLAPWDGLGWCHREV